MERAAWCDDARGRVAEMRLRKPPESGLHPL